MASVLAVALRLPDDHTLGSHDLRAIATVVGHVAQFDGGRTTVLDVSSLDLTASDTGCKSLLEQRKDVLAAFNGRLIRNHDLSIISEELDQCFCVTSGNSCLNSLVGLIDALLRSQLDLCAAVEAAGVDFGSALHNSEASNIPAAVDLVTKAEMVVEQVGSLYNAIVAKLVALLHIHRNRKAHLHCLAKGCDGFLALGDCHFREQKLSIRSVVLTHGIDFS